ncbi:MAG: tryptophan-rich sensory protein [Anaerolineae bacterium]|nr:tryptophan-rich sensory protein [Anaerolineae bacterium]
MNKNTIRQVIVAVTTLVTIIFNGLANALPLNGLSTGDISDRFDVYFVPAAYVFSIWGLIYLGLIAFSIYQALPAQRENPRLQKIGYLYVFSSLANNLWLFLWHYEIFPLTIVAMLALLGLLIAIYLRLNTEQPSLSDTERWLVNIPFSIYLGWVTVATIANITSLLDYLNWNGWGISEEIWTVIMLVAATAIASLMSLTKGDIPYLLVVVWAFIGIAIKHTATPIVTIASWGAAAIVMVMLIEGAVLKQHRALRQETKPA